MKADEDERRAYHRSVAQNVAENPDLVRAIFANERAVRALCANEAFIRALLANEAFIRAIVAGSHEETELRRFSRPTLGIGCSHGFMSQIRKHQRPRRSIRRRIKPFR